MKMNDNIRNNLLTIKGLSEDIREMDSSEPKYFDFVSRIEDAKMEIIRAVNGKDVGPIMGDYLLNNFNHFIRGVFSKKELTDLI